MVDVVAVVVTSKKNVCLCSFFLSFLITSRIRKHQGGKSGSRDRGIVCIPVSPTDPLYPRIANGSSVSYVSPMDPVYRRWILCIANGSCVSPMDPVYRRWILCIARWILCIANGSPVSSIDLFISSLHSPHPRWHLHILIVYYVL